MVLMTESTTLIVPHEHVWELPPYPMRTWLADNLKGRYTLTDHLIEIQDGDYEVEKRITFQNSADMSLFQSLWDGEVVHAD
jgi:hypothetical protein